MKISERVDKHTHIPEEKLVLHPPFPDAIKIELTGRCNLACNFCAVKQRLREQGDMDEKFLYRILDELKDIGVKEIGLFLLGESFLVEKLPQYIKRCKDLGFEYVFITTNGTLCTPERLKAVIGAGLDSLKISVNAPDRKRYEEMHGADLFDVVMDTIKWLGKYKKDNNLSIKTCLSSIFIPKWEEDFKKFHEEVRNYVDETYFLPFYNLAGHVAGGDTKGNVGRLENPSKSTPCWVLFNASKITWDGWMTACYSDHDERFKIVNLNEKTILEGWNSPEIVELRRQHLEGDFNKDSFCAKCLGIC